MTQVLAQLARPLPRGRAAPSVRADTLVDPVARHGLVDPLQRSSVVQLGRNGGAKKGGAKVNVQEQLEEQRQAARDLWLGWVSDVHLAGETEGKAGVKGGHVLTAMQRAWGDRLSLVEPAEPPGGAEPWSLTWRIDARNSKGSSMFPPAWSLNDVRTAIGSGTPSSISKSTPSGQTIAVDHAGSRFSVTKLGKGGDTTIFPVT